MTTYGLNDDGLNDLPLKPTLTSLNLGLDLYSQDSSGKMIASIEMVSNYKKVDEIK